MMAPRRLGMFGGAFDPPHNTHAALIELAVAQLQLDELRVFPTGQAWHKARQLSPVVHRLAMAELAFAKLPKVVVDDRETCRTGPSYTVDTLRELKAEEPQAELFLMIGGDQARALPTWHEWQAILQLAIICVAEREDSTRATPEFMPPTGLESRFLRLELPPSPVSASDIRLRIATHRSVAPLVCEPVARYIVHHHLYQTV
jgi:nicotinate-nucleotide adenylyltransferase